ncbi:hypothetical protein BGW38_006671, partial [Lunasporangiospora selenospora]
MAFEHPFALLDVGTTSANLDQALDSQTELKISIKSCLNEAVRQANETKRVCQELIGCYLEAVFSTGPTEEDRKLFSILCPAVSSGVTNDAADTEEYKQSQHSAHLGFYCTLLGYLYSEKPIVSKGSGVSVKLLLDRVSTLRLDVRRVERNISYPTRQLLRSVAVQLLAEIIRVYCNGSLEMESMTQCESRDKRGFVHRGSILIDGFRMYILAFKMK